MASSHDKRGSFLARLLGESEGGSPPRLPEGEEYIRIVEEHEAAAEKATGAYLPPAGERAPRTWENLWACMAVLDGLSSCWWGCAGGDHAVERLIARVLGSIRAALRLARAGLYDEALNALRTAGEVVNLVTLMENSPELLTQWRKAPPADRYAMARPMKVIKELQALGREESSLNAEKYDLLSRIAHGNADTAPQAYNVAELPLTAGHFQEAGFLVVLNEAALLTALALVPGVALIDLEPEVRRDLLVKGRTLVESAGFITVEHLGETLDSQRADAHATYQSRLSEHG